MKAILLMVLGMFAVAYSAKYRLVIASTSAKRILQLQRDFELCGFGKDTEVWHPDANQASFSWSPRLREEFLLGLQKYLSHEGVEHEPHTDYENTQETVMIVPLDQHDADRIAALMTRHGLTVMIPNTVTPQPAVSITSKNPTTTRSILYNIAYSFGVVNF